MDEITLISKLQPTSSKNWGGSITFLQRYVSQALKKIKEGPKFLDDPNEEFMNTDMEEFCKSKVVEVIPGERYQCEICQKFFKG